jgi:ATP adenylyltransferase
VKKETSSAKKRIIEKYGRSFAMLNMYPYNNGHVMVAPYRHVESLELLSESELIDLITLMNRVKKRIDRKMGPHGYNIGLNIGRIAGAGFAGHVHVHLVPRWDGDTNFMPVISDVKVVSESLDTVYEALKAR